VIKLRKYYHKLMIVEGWIKIKVKAAATESRFILGGDSARMLYIVQFTKITTKFMKIVVAFTGEEFRIGKNHRGSCY